MPKQGVPVKLGLFVEKLEKEGAGIFILLAHFFNKKGAGHRDLSLNLPLIFKARDQMNQLVDHQCWYLHVPLVSVA